MPVGRVDVEGADDDHEQHDATLMITMAALKRGALPDALDQDDGDDARVMTMAGRSRTAPVASQAARVPDRSRRAPLVSTWGSCSRRCR